MKIKHLITILISMICLAGCGRPEFEIVAELASNVSQSYSLTYYASDKKKGWMTETVLNVQQGKGTVKCMTRNPTVVWIATPGPMGKMPVWAEKGDKITIEGDNGNPLEWTIGGNDVNEAWSKWRKENLNALRGNEPKKVNTAVARYVKANPDTELAALMMLTMYYRNENEQEFARLWNSIPAKIKSSELLAAVGRSDLLTAAQIDPPVKVAPFKLHCEGDTIMQINPASADAMLLFFWTGDESDRKACIDSLRNISRENHDGRLFDVTDIALTQDSMSWLNKIREDSLGTQKWRRGWAPGGRLYSGITVFAVNDSPWFVVIDKRGEQVYNGPKVADALRVARQTLRKAPLRKTKVATDTIKTTN